MLVKSRLILALTACLLLSNCALIGSALRMAPYYLLFADTDGKGGADGKAMEMRGREIQNKKGLGFPPADSSAGSQVAFKH